MVSSKESSSFLRFYLLFLIQNTVIPTIATIRAPPTPISTYLKAFPDVGSLGLSGGTTGSMFGVGVERLEHKKVVSLHSFDAHCLSPLQGVPRQKLYIRF